MIRHDTWLLAIAVGAALTTTGLAGDSDANSTVTYQGRLVLDGTVVDEPCDFRFTLWTTVDDASGQVGDLLAAFDVPVEDGVFTVDLDFGSEAFTGKARWLEISVRLTSVGGAYSTLAPRQPLYAAPYSLWAINSPFSLLSGDANSVTLAGSLGIGTLTPLLPLDVVGMARVQEAGDGSGGSVIIDGSGQIQLATESKTTVTLDAAKGNVTAAGFELTGGGVQFSNGSVQTTAAVFYDAGTGLVLDGATFGIASQGVTGSEIADGAVNSAKVANNSLTASDLAAGSVGSSEVINDSLTASDLATNSVQSAEIASGAVGSAEVANNSLTASDLATDSVGAAEIAAGAVGSSEVANNSLTADDLASNSVGASEIQTGAVGASEIASNAVESSELDSDSASLNKVTGGNMVVSSGRIGINTTSPNAELDVENSSGDPTLRLHGPDNQLLFIEADGATWAGSISYNNFGTSAGRLNFQRRETDGDFNDTFMSLFMSDGRLEVYNTALKPGGGSWGVLSDARLKHHVHPIGGALERLLAVQGVTFEYIDPDQPGALPGEQTGVIAQDVERVFPEWVDETGDGLKTVTFRGFEALTIEAIRALRDKHQDELAAIRETQRRQVEEIEALRQALHELRAAMAVESRERE